MSTILIVGIIAFSVFMTGIVMVNIFVIIMIGEINRKQPEGNLVSYFGDSPPKSIRTYREYRSLYPDGRIHIYFWIAVAIEVTGAIGACVCLFAMGHINSHRLGG